MYNLCSYLTWCVQSLLIITYLNVDVLFAGILNKEGKGILPHRAVGSIASLRKRGENVNYAQSLVQCTKTKFYPYLALFSCILNGNLCHWAGVLIAFSHLQHMKSIDVGNR